MTGSTKTGVSVGGLRLPPAHPLGGRQRVRCVGFSKEISAPVRRRELPSPYVTVVLELGDPLVLVASNDDRTRSVGSFVSGLQNEAAITERRGHQYGVHIELAPLAAYAVFGRPMHELTGQLVDLDALLGSGAGHLDEQIAAAKTWPDAFRVLEASLAARVAAGPSPAPAVAWAWQKLRAAKGSLRIEQLVEGAGMSHRHLAARFREQIGLTPKALARLLRFDHSLSLLRDGNASLAGVADAAGYYDQSHLNRDFRAMAACSPRIFLGQRRADEVIAGGSDFSKTA